MSDLQKEFDRLEENSEKMDKLFDTPSEGLEYSENRISSLEEEIYNLEKNFDKFNDIINSYDDYKDCFKEYIIKKYEDYSVFMFFEVFVYAFSIIIIIQTPVFIAKIFFVILLIIVTIFNFTVKNNVHKIRNDIKNEIYDKYGIDLTSLSAEDIDDMEMSLLQNKIRSVNLRKEIDEYEYYIFWKEKKMSK